MKKDKDLLDDDEEDDANFKDVEDEAEYEKDEVVLVPEKIEEKPRTKLSFIAPRIPVNRKGFGFGINALQEKAGAEREVAPGKSAGGIKIGFGGAVVKNPAAFAGQNAFMDANVQEKARQMQKEVADSFYGASEISATMQARAREHELQTLKNFKSEEDKLKKNAVKMNILDTIQDFRLTIPDFASMGLEPIPC